MVWLPGSGKFGLFGRNSSTGCFCNPGACAKYLGLSHKDILSNIEAGHVCWDDQDILNGKPTGAVRVSFGYMSTFEDARKFMDFMERSFVSFHSIEGALSARSPPLVMKGTEKIAMHFLTSITVYPIKSCAGFSTDRWPLTSTGLLHDREWLLRSASGEVLSQKKKCVISKHSLISSWEYCLLSLLAAKRNCRLNLYPI